LAAVEAADKFAVLCKIARAQHFAWREAVAELHGEDEVASVVMRMWELTGRQTGGAYAPRLDRDQALAPQVAKSVVWSSRCMGEDAHLEVSEDGSEAFVRHEACPWFDWHKRLGLLEEDRAGCDCWFSTTVDAINKALGTKLRVETLSTLPDGDTACVRRFWAERDG
jgi:hypothetical protein